MNTLFQQTANCQITNCLTEGVHLMPCQALPASKNPFPLSFQSLPVPLLLQIISLELATVELRATTLPAHLQIAPSVEARVAVCKFFALKISALRFLKTIDLRQNHVLQLAENKGIVRSPPGGGGWGGTNQGKRSEPGIGLN
jgi:hypothetical protein